MTNGVTDYDLKFCLLDIGPAQTWTKHLKFFVDAGQPWDDTKRFYNFPNTEFTKEKVIQRLRQLVNTIKAYAPNIINYSVGDSLTQDDLNYLHHIFEVYHGLYDQQNTNDFFCKAPKEVQDALGDLNIWIHRYETLGGFPRFVATWKYKPYRDKFIDSEFKYFTLDEEWGDLRLNYCEIGKTLYDLWNDNDKHIFPDAFKPQHHYCFDFTVRFSEYTKEYYQNIENNVWNYFEDNKEFFNNLGYKKYDPKLSLGGVTIGKIIANNSRQEIISSIACHQTLKSIRIDQ